ncbi:hypothetical protein M0811_09779 [Anaeramoeba ignava]|uniref:E3 ubiquitin-protein ligase synoviolin-like TPR repeats domain-containing protein n=1 Tax=Anaeramoeba ignava TaxID=1746090 RepID=A0A9Q0LHC9_ANAIG|nr:hypothetical protein M0811_09779 [Anaeramoeba ignava]
MSFVSKSYFYISFMAFAMVLSQELQENQNQFFQALVSISNRSLPSLTLMNIVAMILFFIWNFITKLVYGNLNEFELDTLFETGYRKLVDFLLIAGMSGYKSTKEGIFIFFILLLLREWNEIANLRFSLILQNPFVPLSQKLRIFFGVVLFMFIDFSLFKLSLNEMTQNFPSIHIIFSIEFLLIVVEVFFLYIRSVFLLISSDKTDELLIYLEPIKELLKFLVMLIAFILLFMGGDIPFNFFPRSYSLF